MEYKIKNAEDKTIDQVNSSQIAYRSCVILNAHEIMNGRGWMYHVDPDIDPIPFEELNLPDWAIIALANHCWLNMKST